MSPGIVVGNQDRRAGWPPFTRWFTSDAGEVTPARKVIQSVADSLEDTA